MPLIGISGPSASGKTTLAKHIARECGFALVREDIRGVVNALSSLARLKSPSALDAAIAATNAWVESRNAALGAHDALVMDRTAIDILRFWFDYARVMPDELFFWIRDLCQDQVAKLDAVVILPAEQFSAPHRNEDGLNRRTEASVMARNHAMTIGFANLLCSGKIIAIPPGKSTEERARLIVSSL